MKRFYVIKDEKQTGPFTIEELRQGNITSETMVWHEEAPDWVKAGSVPELQNIIKIAPPPFNPNTKVSTPPPFSPAEVSAGQQNSEPKKKKRRAIWIVIPSILLICGIGAFVAVNHEKEQNMRYELQELNSKLIEQERIENQRKEEEERIRRAEIKQEYNETVTNLRAARIKLEDIKKFKLLRSADEKEAQVQEQLELISNLENRVEMLQTALEQR